MTNAERQKRYRDNKRNAPSPDSGKSVTVPGESVTNPAPNVTENPSEAQEIRENTISARVASLEDYNAHPDDYAFRACAELLNWGSWMSADELKFSSFSANRQVVPGDWDYNG